MLGTGHPRQVTQPISLGEHERGVIESLSRCWEKADWKGREALVMVRATTDACGRQSDFGLLVPPRHPRAPAYLTGLGLTCEPVFSSLQRAQIRPSPNAACENSLETARLFLHRTPNLQIRFREGREDAFGPTVLALCESRQGCCYMTYEVLDGTQPHSRATASFFRPRQCLAQSLPLSMLLTKPRLSIEFFEAHSSDDASSIRYSLYSYLRLAHGS